MGNNYLTEKEQAEVKAHSIGKIMLFIGVIPAILAILCLEGDSGVTVAFIGCVIMAIGIALMMHNRSAGKIEQDHRTVETWVKMAKSGMPAKKVADAVCGESARRQKAETKEIIKGAAIGAVVAGDAGAIVGATIAKNKIDNQKK